MIDKRIRQYLSSWGRSLHLLLVVALMLPFIGVTLRAAQAPGLAGHVQPLLLQMAAEQPDQTVAVIVQKAVKDTRIEDRVAALGGTVTKDLHIINALAAEMKAKDVLQLAQAEGVRWVSLDAPTVSSSIEQAAPLNATASGGTAPGPMFTTWASASGTTVASGFTSSASMFDSLLGPNGVYGYGAKVKGSFGGFVAEVTPGNDITKVELVLKSYVPAKLGTGEDPTLSIYIGGGQAGQSVNILHQAFDPYVGVAKAGLLYVDITSSRAWQWADFDKNLELSIDQTKLSKSHSIYIDAVGLRVTSAPGSGTTGDTGGDTSADTTINTNLLANVYNQVIGATQLWNNASKLRGRGVTVAVVDSGILKTKLLDKRLRANANFNAGYHDAGDRFGHGTFVAHVVAGNIALATNQYVGVAPRADVLNVRVSDDQGMSVESDVVNALQWVLNNKARYNIRVVNLSLNSSVAQSYNTSPLDAACEILWFNGIVVVVSAGNNGTATLYPPANDPFVITVGATNDAGTVSLTDDAVASFSAYGTTESGFAKPDLVAPGKNIIGVLPDNDQLNMGKAHASNRIDKTFFRMSGTSVSAPMVSGAVTLLLQDEPNLNPDQVKYRLKTTANKTWPGYNATTAGAGYLDIYAAVNGTTTQTANTGTFASNLLSTGNPPVSQLWGSAQWGSAQWGSAQWGSAQWGSAQWGSAQWGSDYWGP